MPDLYALPLSLAEFTTWYTHGVNRVLAARLVPLEEKMDSAAIIREHAASSLPSYDDDFEAFFAHVQIDRPLVLQEMRGGFVLPAAIDVPFECLLGVHPSTERSARMLPSRLPKGIAVGAPLFVTEATAEDERRARERARRGGRALLSIAGLAEHAARFEGLEPEVWHAIKLRDREVGFPVPKGSFVDNILNYDRHKPTYPRTPLGYAFDYGAVLTYGNTAASQEHVAVAKDLSAALSTLVRSGVQEPWERYDDLRPHLDRATALTDDRFPAASCVAFFQLQDEIRETGGIGDSFDGLIRQMTKLRLDAELALALFLVGHFFGFSRFADSYYADVRERRVGRTAVELEPDIPKEIVSTDHAGRSRRTEADPSLFDKGSVRDGNGAVQAETLTDAATLDPRGGGKSALLKEDVGVLVHMIRAAVAVHGVNHRLPWEEAEMVVAGVFKTKRYEDVRLRLVEARDRAKEQGILSVQDEDLILA